MVDNGVQVMIFLRCTRYEGYSATVENEVKNYFESEGFCIPPDDYRPLSCENIVFGSAIFSQGLLIDSELISDLESNHWLMATNPPGEALQQILSKYTPGQMLVDQEGRFWVRRAKMCISRYRFINPAGDEQEKFYEQKYLLNIPISENDDILSSPQSWMQLCIMKGLFDEHADAMSSLQSALSRGFHMDSLRELARLYTDHGFITEDEADSFMAEVPTVDDSINEPQAHVTDQLLGDPTHSDLGNLLPNRQSFDLNEYLKTFTESQYRAFSWIRSQLDQGKQVQAAIIGPAGTGKSYLLQALIKQMRSQCLVVCKLAPSGVAAHLIGGTTIHNFFCLDLECNTSLEHGTFQTTRLRKTDVIVIDEFSMLDFFVFRTMEGLCRKFAKRSSSRHPWGGRHVILLGDPAQLPAVSGVDIFGTYLWHKFTVLLLREIKCATDPILSQLLTKIREGICDSHVTEILQTRLQRQDINAIDLDKTVIICSTRTECDKINDECLERISGPMCEYEADDCDNHGKGLRAADYQRIQHHRERLPDKLQLKVGARVILRRNMDIDAGWVNGTLAVVIALYQNCVVIQKMSNPSQRIPVPRFRQRIEINGASYSTLRHQFPLQLAYAVTVHRIQGLTVQKAIICLNSSFFASGQAYVALSRVRNLHDMILWDFCPAIHLLQFYKDLLKWCDCVDAIRPTPSTDIVPFPNRSDDISSNAPLANNADNVDTHLSDNDMNSTHLSFDKQQSRKRMRTNNSQAPPVKRNRLGPSNSCATCPPNHSSLLLPISQNVTAPNRQLQHLNQLQTTVAQLLNESPAQILSRLSSFATSPNVAGQFRTITPALELIIRQLNSFPLPYADALPDIMQDTCVSNRCHPLLLQILKPIRTTGDGNCMYNALSLTLTGTEHFTHLIRLLCAYAMVKYKHTMISAFAFPSNTQASHEQMYERALLEALQVGVWGSDYQLFPFSLLMNRPIFQYNTFFISDTSDSGITTLTLSDAIDVTDLPQRFMSYDTSTRCHILYCGNVHRVLLASGDVNTLPHMPLCLFNVGNQHWVAMLLQSNNAVCHLPIPLTRILTD